MTTAMAPGAVECLKEKPEADRAEAALELVAADAALANAQANAREASRATDAAAYRWLDSLSDCDVAAGEEERLTYVAAAVTKRQVGEEVTHALRRRDAARRRLARVAHEHAQASDNAVGVSVGMQLLKMVPDLAGSADLTRERLLADPELSLGHRDVPGDMVALFRAQFAVAWRCLPDYVTGHLLAYWDALRVDLQANAPRGVGGPVIPDVRLQPCVSKTAAFVVSPGDVLVFNAFHIADGPETVVTILHELAHVWQHALPTVTGRRSVAGQAPTEHIAELLAEKWYMQGRGWQAYGP